MLYDSHAHINNQDFSPSQRKEVIAGIENAVKSGILSYVNDVGFNLESSALAAKHAEAFPWCYAVVGCHPHDVKRFDEEQLAMIGLLAKKKKVKAIGEIGLDFYRNISDPDTQRYWFRQQIRLANDLKMPIVIHDRDANQEVFDTLKEEGAFSKDRQSMFPKRVIAGKDGALEGDSRVLLHCYSGSLELAKEYVKMGATISIAGPITYKNARRLVDVVEGIPLDYLLVETDAPYLTPEPFRGRQNLPEYVEHTARRVGIIKKMEYEQVAKITCNNAKVFFGI